MLIAALLTLACFPTPGQDHDVQASPFDALRWDEGRPEALVDGAWYRPLAIDGVAVSDVLAACARRWPGQVEKRFGEDLVEVLVGLGWEGDLAVDLDLARIPGGEEVRLEGVAMTRARRNAIRDAARRAGRAAPPATVSADAARRDVDAFEAGLRERFAYLSLAGLDLAAELEPLRAGLAGEVSTVALADALHRVLMRFGDGHAYVRVALPTGVPGDRFLPLLLADSAAGVVALLPDRTAFVDPDRPVVVEIDGRPIDAWIAAAAPRVAAGSPQGVRRRALGELRAIDALRRELGLETGVPLRLTLTDAEGGRRTTRELALAEEWPRYGDWPRSETGVLAGGDLGYLRIAEMHDRTDELRAAMDRLVDTRGLIVDVRGNGGGSRDLLLALAGYLIGPDEPAVVGSVAAYRRSPAFARDHLEARFMRRAGWPGWSARQRDAIAAFAPGFEPEWTPPEAMSEWHYLVLDRTGDPGEYHYGDPVVVLSDSGCFSATDVFLGALELLPRVTLVGAASSGGSARSQGFRLPATGIEVRCASMASYRPDGRLYERRGVEVDVEVLPRPGDLLFGGGDAQLDAAVRLLGG